MRRNTRNHLQLERHRSPRPVGRRAAAVVEAAMVLPLVLLIVLTLVDLALAVVQYNSLAECARRGARAAIVRGGECISPSSPVGPDDWSGTAADVHPVADALRPSLICLRPEDVQLTVSWPDGGNRRGQTVRVDVTYDHRSLVTLLADSPWTLSATSTMPIVH